MFGSELRNVEVTWTDQRERGGGILFDYNELTSSALQADVGSFGLRSDLKLQSREVRALRTIGFAHSGVEANSQMFRNFPRFK